MGAIDVNCVQTVMKIKGYKFNIVTDVICVHVAEYKTTQTNKHTQTQSCCSKRNEEYLVL